MERGNFWRGAVETIRLMIRAMSLTAILPAINSFPQSLLNNLGGDFLLGVMIGVWIVSAYII